MLDLSSARVAYLSALGKVLLSDCGHLDEKPAINLTKSSAYVKNLLVKKMTKKIQSVS